MIQKILSKGLLLSVVWAALANIAAAQMSSGVWVTSWMTANAANDEPVTFSKQTVRNIVHVALGGKAIRIHLANTFGTQAVRFDAVTIGIQKDGAAIVPGSLREVTFAGSKTIRIPEGAEALSDPVALEIPEESNLAISLFTDVQAVQATMHGSALQTSYISETGNFASEQGSRGFSKTTESWFFLSSVDVLTTREGAGAIVALGDSITDGASARSNKNERWTDVLAERLREKHNAKSVLNAGIGGNRVLTSSPCWGANALARLDRDVLSNAGVRAVILFEGTNDIGQPDTPSDSPCMSRTPVSAEDIIAGYQQIIARVRARGLKIFGATILPYQGFRGWTAQGEAKRVAVNQWIRTSKAFDGVFDFDAAVRDPANPARFAAKFDGGDHLHPGPVGHKAMADAINIDLLP